MNKPCFFAGLFFGGLKWTSIPIRFWLSPLPLRLYFSGFNGCIVRRLYLLLLVLFACNAHALDYYWVVPNSPTHTTNFDTSVKYSSPQAALTAIMNNICTTRCAYGPVTQVSITVQDFSPTVHAKVSYSYKHLPGANPTVPVIRLRRYGDTCPPDETYDTLTGACKADPCKPTLNQVIGNRVAMGVIQASGNTISKTDPPGSVCKNNCQYAWNGSNAQNVYRFIEGADNTIYGDYLYKGNGVTCSATDTPPVPRETTATSPVRNKDASCTGTVTDPQGGGVSSQCTATDEYRDPGSLSCGQMNGGWVCTVVSGKSPKAVKKTVTTDTNTVTNPDGSKTTTKSTVTVVKDCSGFHGCRDTTTGKVETSGTNADGSPGSSTTTGTCTGPGCGSGTGTGEGDGKGEGDGITDEELAGTCDPATDNNQCGLKSASGFDCSVTLACSGDAIQCAMLQEQKTARCTAQYDSAAIGSINAQIAADPSFTLEETEVDASGLFTDGMNAARWLPSSCPSDKTLSAMGFSYSLSMQPVCTAAVTLSNIIVGLAVLFFAVYVGRSTGGE